MKLAYSNWHKELVHDDAIRGELSTLTKAQLAFTDNTPFVKVYREREREDRYGKRGKTGFQNRGGNGNRPPNKNRGPQQKFNKKRFK